VIGRWVSLLAVRAGARLVVRLLKIAAITALIVAAAPVSVCAAIAAGGAWLAGWPPARLYRAALWCAPMVAVWLAAIAASHGWAALIQAPYQAWLATWRDGAAGDYAAAAAVIAPAAIPLGLAAGGLAWSYRISSMQAGSGGRSPAAAVAFDLRQWRHQVRSARARIAAPGSVPLNSGNGGLIAGAVIRAVNHRPRQIAVIPYQRMRSHQVVIGTTGTGKTTLLLRLWAGFVASALQRHSAGAGGLPLLVVLDCKGGGDARRIADRARRVLRAAGAATTAIWPDEASLSLWALPPDQLITTLVDLIEHGTGGAAYYADVMEAVVALAVQAPPAPPTDTADFLARLEPGWLTMAYAAGEHDDAHALIRAAGRQIGDIALRFRTLFRRLGTGLDGPGGFGDADAWYCILEGTGEISVAEGQARALVDLLTSYATAGPGGPAQAGGREILLAVDEFSAVSRRLPIWQLYERARSLGLAVQVSAQSWPGLAASEDERYRIAATADGGIWLLRTPQPEPVAALAGDRQVMDTTRRLLGVPLWSHQGTSRMRLAPVVDPALIRALDVGQAAYIYRGGATYVQVKRLVAAPAALGGRPAANRKGAPAAAGRGAASAAEGYAGTAAGPAGAGAGARAATARAATAAAAGRLTGEQAPQPAAARPPVAALPDVTGLLDEAFGTEAPP
jgi:hypothetical protein